MSKISSNKSMTDLILKTIRETKKELENLSNFDKERMTKLRDAIESLVINGSESYPKGGKEWDNDYIRRVLSQTLKEFDIVLSKN